MAIQVCSFESRRQDEMASLIQKFGGIPTVAPSMREVPLNENKIAAEFADRLLNGEIDLVLFMTGVGARTLFDAIAEQREWQPIRDEMDRRGIIVRGPKPVPVLKQAGIHIDYRAPEPNTWRELLRMIDDEQVELDGKVIAVQEYGRPNETFYRELEQRGATIMPVPVYRWEFPEDVEPLNAAIRQAIDQPFDVVMFTSANQVDNVLQAAENLGEKEAFLHSLKRSRIASIGPTCSDRLNEYHLDVAMEPTRPKMAFLVREAIEFAKAKTT